MHVNAGVMPYAGEHGVQREADKHGDQHRRHDGDAELMEKLADDAAHKANRQKHGHDRQSGRQHGQANLLRAIHGCVIGIFAHLDVAHNVLAHHNRIVNQQAHAQ